MTYIPDRLWRARVEARLTQHDLAERVGRSASAISKWEHGRSVPRKRDLERLAEVLDKPREHFLSDHLSFREQMYFKGSAGEGPEVNVDRGGRLVEGHFKGRSDEGGYVVAPVPGKKEKLTRFPLMTAKEAAGILGVSESAVRRLTAKGELAHVRIGKLVRISPDDLDEYIRTHEVRKPEEREEAATEAHEVAEAPAETTEVAPVQTENAGVPAEIETQWPGAKPDAA